jgi:hypothetical protein
VKYVRVTFSLWGVECRLIFGPFVGPWAAIWLDSVVLYPPVIDGWEVRITRALIVDPEAVP